MKYITKLLAIGILVLMFSIVKHSLSVAEVQIQPIQPTLKERKMIDLIPKTSPGQPDNGTGFCTVVDNKWKVVFSIKEQGGADAPSSSAKIEFSPGGVVTLNVHPIPGMSVINVPPVNIPAGCFNPDCDFKITVDSGEIIFEGNEKNNTAIGTCIG